MQLKSHVHGRKSLSDHESHTSRGNEAEIGMRETAPEAHGSLER